jgi:hypothetical protein
MHRLQRFLLLALCTAFAGALVVTQALLVVASVN